MIAGRSVRNLVPAFLILCVIVGAYRLLKRPPSFAHATSEIAVTRIGPSGDVVHETLNPLLAPYLAVYHGAGWCPPCQRFSPTLAEFYHSADKTGKRFQLVMVNYDRSEADMLAYMRQHSMEFPAVMLGSAGPWGKSTGSGIPNLMIIDTATGKVVSSSFEGDTYVGPAVPLDVLRNIAR
jgi:thiol-disulfide isomerase/thioredoxin